MQLTASGKQIRSIVHLNCWFQPLLNPKMGDYNAAPVLTAFGERKECRAIVPKLWPMPQGTSRPGSSQVMLG
jgi:hypothetical protein